MAVVIEGLGSEGQIGTGAECPTPTGDDDGPHGVVLVDAVEHVEQLDRHPGGERVELLGAVQGDRGDAGLHAIVDLFVGHGRP